MKLLIKKNFTFYSRPGLRYSRSHVQTAWCAMVSKTTIQAMLRPLHRTARFSTPGCKHSTLSVQDERHRGARHGAGGSTAWIARDRARPECGNVPMLRHTHGYTRAPPCTCIAHGSHTMHIRHAAEQEEKVGGRGDKPDGRAAEEAPESREPRAFGRQLGHAEAAPRRFRADGLFGAGTLF